MILYSPSIQRYVILADMPYNDLKELANANGVIFRGSYSTSEYYYRAAIDRELKIRRLA